MNVLSYVFSIMGFFNTLYVCYSVVVRYLKIKDLPVEVLKNSEKQSYLQTLIKYVTVSIVGMILNLLSLFLPWLEVRLIISVISIITVTHIYSDLLDEIADFDTSKKDSDILLDYLKSTKEDSKKKAKDNKIKKVDSLSLSEEDYNDIKNKNK